MIRTVGGQPSEAEFFKIGSNYRVQTVLHIMPDFHIHSTKPLPNRWRRFWHWALLGWTYETIDAWHKGK